MFKYLTICLAFSSFGTNVSAQNYDVRNDMQVWAAVDQMAMGLGTGCQMGDQRGCQAYQYLQQLTGYLVQTNDACIRGQQQACQEFQQVYAQLDSDYGEYMTYYAPQLQGGGGGVNPMGATHDERMANIQQWGADSTRRWQENGAMMDQRQEEFLQTLRE